MSVEQRIEDALADFECLLVTQTSVEDALAESARGHGFEIEAVRVQAERRFGDLFAYSAALFADSERRQQIEDLVRQFRMARRNGEEPFVEALLRDGPKLKFIFDECEEIRRRCRAIESGSRIDRGEQVDW